MNRGGDTRRRVTNSQLRGWGASLAPSVHVSRMRTGCMCRKHVPEACADSETTARRAHEQARSGYG